jgi:hypothetical protein
MFLYYRDSYLVRKSGGGGMVRGEEDWLVLQSYWTACYIHPPFRFGL